MIGPNVTVLHLQPDPMNCVVSYVWKYENHWLQRQWTPVHFIPPQIVIFLCVALSNDFAFLQKVDNFLL